MAEIIKRRTLRPSSRRATSSYKVDTTMVTAMDTLIVNIDHEDNPGEIIFSFRFDGSQLAEKRSIHFKEHYDGSIKWIGITPTS